MLKCRVCFADCDQQVLLNLYDKPATIFDTKNRIAVILSEVTQIKVAAEENLPKNICFPCCYQLKDAQSFIKKAKQTDKLLRSNLKITENRFSNDITIIPMQESPKKGGTTIFTDDSVNSFKEETDDKMLNCDPLSLTDELETHKIKTSLSTDHLQNIQNDATENSECVSEENCFRAPVIENLFSINDQAVFHEKHFLLKECEIKLEPMVFDEFTEYHPEESIMNPDVKMEIVPTADHIKVEPLSGDVALMYHQQNEVEEYPSLLNGYHEESYFENEVKPTEEDLTNCANEYQLNNSIPKVTKIFSCRHCHKVLGTEQSKLRHEQKHGIKMFNERCLLCNKQFNSESKLKHHVIKSHSYGEGFDFEMEDSDNSDSEDRLKPKVKMMKCEHCPTAKFTSRRDYKKHLKTHRDKGGKPNNHLIMCIKCNRTFINKAAILSHFRHFHAQNTVIKVEKPDEAEVQKNNTKNGTKKVNTENATKKIVRKKGKQGGHTNVKISKNMKNITSLDKEGRKIRKKKTEFKYKKTIYKTVNIQIEKERNYLCTICKNRFIRKDHLTRHTRCVHGTFAT